MGIEIVVGLYECGINQTVRRPNPEPSYSWRKGYKTIIASLERKKKEKERYSEGIPYHKHSTSRPIMQRGGFEAHTKLVRLS